MPEDPVAGDPERAPKVPPHDQVGTMIDPKKLAWIAICGGVAAIFTGAIAEVLSGSHAIAIGCAVLGGALGGVFAFYFD